MQQYYSITELRAALGRYVNIALVPTMGSLHSGHLSLMREARRQVDQFDGGGVVVASVFVNRLQFGDHEDFGIYPRDLANDARQLQDAGVDYLFAPDEREIYPQPQKFVIEHPPIYNQLEGLARPGHFSGVATIVLKLFNIVQPKIAVFGKKDYQQLVMIRNMAQQLALPVGIIGGETVRDDDGLALSSRNAYLSDKERQEAPRLYNCLRALRDNLISAEADPDYDAYCHQAMADLRNNGWLPDYVAVRRQHDLAPIQSHDGLLVIVGAARLGKTRLLDNIELAVC